MRGSELADAPLQRNGPLYGETVYVDVEDAGILMDVDDPAAYERLLAGQA